MLVLLGVLLVFWLLTVRKIIKLKYGWKNVQSSTKRHADLIAIIPAGITLQQNGLTHFHFTTTTILRKSFHLHPLVFVWSHGSR
jgi:hypothetical protein